MTLMVTSVAVYASTWACLHVGTLQECPGYVFVLSHPNRTAGRSRGVGTHTPERMGYLPVRNAVLLGVHREAAEMCWLSLTPSAAKRSIFGVLGRERDRTLGRDAGRRDREIERKT